MARKKKDECKSIPGWLVSFGDLMSLLLTFFILLYSMSTISIDKFFQSIRGLLEAFGGRTFQSTHKIISKRKVDLNFPHLEPKIKKKKAIVKKLSEIVQMLNRAGIKTDFETHGSYVKLRIMSDKIFPSGKEYPYKKAIPYLMTFCDRLKDSSLPIMIVGHTDNVPIFSKRFRNNLELSAARAAYILRLFIKCGYDEKAMAAEGRGEYEPLVPNISAQNREKNRRIEFLIDISA
jgi:chemotaxis protein MotB